MIACIGERSYVKVTAGTPAFCVVCDDEEVVKWYMSIGARLSGRKVVRTTLRKCSWLSCLPVEAKVSPSSGAPPRVTCAGSPRPCSEGSGC